MTELVPLNENDTPMIAKIDVAKRALAEATEDWQRVDIRDYARAVAAATAVLKRKDIQVHATNLIHDAERAIVKANPAIPIEETRKNLKGYKGKSIGKETTPTDKKEIEQAGISIHSLRDMRKAHKDITDEEFEEKKADAVRTGTPFPRYVLTEEGRRKRKERREAQEKRIEDDNFKLEKTPNILWKAKFNNYMQKLSKAAIIFKSIMLDYPHEEGEKRDRKRMRQDIKEVLDNYNTPEMKTLADLLRKLPLFDKRANELNGKEWLRNSISVWDDIRKSSEERKLGHPAMFPVELAKRLIECFTNDSQDTILDPFAGVGSTLIAAKELNKDAIGIELSQEFTNIAINRINNIDKQLSLFNEIETKVNVHVADSRTLCEHIDDNSIDMVITSPPYWDILIEKRPLYPKDNANYGDTENDLGKVRDYDKFLTELKTIFAQVYRVMKPNTYCCIIVMDIRKGNRLYPLHMDISMFMEDIGYQLDDLIVWNRAQDYNHLYTLGYPSKFRINRIHEFILIFHKPEDTHVI